MSARIDTAANHRGGPDTSVEAAALAALRSSELRALVHRTLFDDGDHTVDEVCRLTGRPRYSLQPRFTELRKLGLIRDSGERRFNRSGARAIVWRSTVRERAGGARGRR